MKNYVFVGGSRGIGRVAALKVARGNSVLVVSRGKARAEATVKELREAGAQAEWLEADLSSTTGVLKAASEVKSWRSSLNGLVHSAMDVDLKAGRSVSVDGFDFPYAMQFHARALMNRELIDSLAASDDGRVVHVAAVPPKRTVPDFDDLHFQRRKWRLMSSLMSSQLLGLLHVQASAKHWAHLPVAVSAACVGPTKTEAIDQQAWWVRALYSVIATTTERSAENVVRFLNDTQRFPGAVTLQWKKFTPTPVAFPEAWSERAWELTQSVAR